MRAALRLARNGIGTTHPNPRVGAVVVRDGVLLGRGWHVRPGGPHAEVAALADAGEGARGATLYVTLEPCAGHGRTPPCCHAILAAGIRRVVYGSTDPNPRMAGGGAWLADHGIAVTGGVLAEACDRLNRPFLHGLRRQRPWILAKAAVSLDGKLATETGEARWISSEESRRHLHRIRAEMDAIVVGGGTLCADDPRLTPRGVRRRGANPLRVVIARRLPPFMATAHLCDDAAPSRIYWQSGRQEDAARWRESGVELVAFRRLEEVFDHLYREGRLAVMVEGGGRLFGALFRARLVDELLLYQAPLLLGGERAVGLWMGDGVDRVGQAPRLIDPVRRRLGCDQWIRGLIGYPGSERSSRRNGGPRTEAKGAQPVHGGSFVAGS
ncbi:MAG: bifunctional diaminohydroxyphosphoribosylaminopyrimidine deaminase/5-amino-6-(5-phosphoribosylamino)uracil reductase RibD [Zetaproteobacteria bacterium]|nr:MAG: bifunctional diaminohydroxyphosphoribosylaminopyrimidine deaminase/5-amino-6-(5-phosphoribosylamino)uracil reductase RibD [Zetaproteobacteria bacterium]